MAVSGTASATVTGYSSPLVANITVTPRTGFAVSAPSPAAKVANGTAPLPTLTAPPNTSEGSFGWAAYVAPFIVHASASIPSGPNTGFVYVTSLDTSTAKFIYELNPGIDNSNDPFAQHQFGNCGIPSLSQIVAAVTAHETGSSNSHWAELVSALTADNPGSFAEASIGIPGTNPTTWSEQTVTPGVQSRIDAAASAAQAEPAANLPAGINYPPYRTCP